MKVGKNLSDIITARGELVRVGVRIKIGVGVFGRKALLELLLDAGCEHLDPLRQGILLEDGVTVGEVIVLHTRLGLA